MAPTRSKRGGDAGTTAGSALQEKAKERSRSRRTQRTLTMSLLKRLWEGTQTVEDDLNVWSDAGWPRHCFHDDDLDRWVDRLNGLRDLLVQRGGFSAKSATKALVNPDPKSKERTALWLSSELAKLRKTEQQVGAAPVRTGAALSRLTIADLAITMVQFLEGPPGENLICLLQELLDVDRHRKALAENPGNEFTRAAMTEAIGALRGRTGPRTG